MIEKKFVKHCEIGELKFDISLNRAMAIKAFETFPNYWETLRKSEALKDAISKQNGKNEIDIDSFSLNATIDLLELSEAIDEESENIVNYLLPKMLEYAETKLPLEYSNYDEYALAILKYCDENNVLYNYIAEEIITEPEYKVIENEQLGFYAKAMQFITRAFTKGGERKKSTVTVVMN